MQPLTIHLPDHVTVQSLQRLADEIAEALGNNIRIRHALEYAGLQPTQRACQLAAFNAVYTLLAHELGQEVAREAAEIEADPTDEH